MYDYYWWYIPMRVTIVGPQFPDSFACNVADGFEEFGCVVQRVEGLHVHHQGSRLHNLFWQNAPKASTRIERWMATRLIDAVRAFQPDLALFTYAAVSPETVDAVRNNTGKVACWYTDAITGLMRHYLLAASWDAAFVKEPTLVSLMRDKLGINAHYLPEACNPRWHRPVDLNGQEHRNYDCDVAAFGSLHYYRARMLEPFMNYDLRIWGANCPTWLRSTVKMRYMHRSVSCWEKAKAVSAARIVINTLNCAEVDGVNCTLFEVAGCGGFQIADLKPSLADLFDPENEIVTFTTKRELAEKVEYFLHRPAKRAEIASRATSRAHGFHTYLHRIEELLRVLNAPHVINDRRHLNCT
jgi:spore maturation protein CgeB